MYEKTTSRLIIYGVAVVILVFLVLQISGKWLFSTGSPFAQMGSIAGFQSAAVVEPGLPVRLVIPDIEVAATVERSGLTVLGAMIAPKSPMSVSWYNIGVRPGQVGNAVMSGHYGWKSGITAAFDKLHLLQPGNKIYVIDDTGTTTVFVVRELRSFGEDDDALDVFTSYDGVAHLNLITCEGVYDKATKSYAKRLVVFADKE